MFSDILGGIDCSIYFFFLRRYHKLKESNQIFQPQVNTLSIQITGKFGNILIVYDMLQYQLIIPYKNAVLTQIGRNDKAIRVVAVLTVTQRGKLP